MSPADEPDHTQFTVEEIAIMVHEAAAHGRTCMAHAQGNQGIRNAVYAGVESIEHGFWLDDEVLAEMKTRGTFLVPTHMANVGFFRRAEKEPGSLLPQSIRKASQVVEASKQSVVT